MESGDSRRNDGRERFGTEGEGSRGNDGRERFGTEGEDSRGNDGRGYIAHVENEAGTVRLAERLAAFAGPGSLLALDGELGAGKTRFAQAFAAALGVPGIVNSPTFTLIKEYEGAQLPFYHMDVYRLSAAEADELGLDDYFYGQGVTLVEWASLIPGLLPPERLHIRLETTGPRTRRIVCEPVGEPYASWCKQLAAQRKGEPES